MIDAGVLIAAMEEDISSGAFKYKDSKDTNVRYFGRLCEFREKTFKALKFLNAMIRFRLLK